MVEQRKNSEDQVEDDQNLFNGFLKRLTYENLTNPKKTEFYIAIITLIITVSLVGAMIRCIWKMCHTDRRSLHKLIEREMLQKSDETQEEEELLEDDEREGRDYSHFN